MLPVEVFFSALFGLVFGSFLNVCIVRLPHGESIVRPRSRCLSCSTPIRSTDNIPVLSWVLLRGRSRCCGQAIALRYPLVEITTAGLFVGCLLAFGPSIEAISMALLCWLLLGLAWMDAETYLLPDAFTIPGIFLGFAYTGIHRSNPGAIVFQSVLPAAGIAGGLLAVALLYQLVRRRQGMGMGDVKLGALLGAWLGWQLSALALFLAVVTAASAGIFWMALGRRRVAAKEKTQAVGGPLRLPFGAFLASAGIVSVFAGEWLLRWYLQFFH